MPAPLPRPLVRLGVVVLAVLVVLAAATGAASAHVSVSSVDAAPGGFGTLTFRVPNESDSASTVGLRISIPEESALAAPAIQPVPGWTVTPTTSDLATPLESHGEQVGTYVSVVEFRAADGGGIRPDEFQEFSVAGGPFPHAGPLVFPAVRTCSDGTEVAWIEPTLHGESEPERPAPVLTLAADDGADGAATGAGGHGDRPASDGGSAAGGSDPGAIALFLAVLAFLTGLAGVVLGWRAGRRTVSS